MKNDKKTELRVGITVTLALIIFVYILSWAKNVSINADRKFLNVRFASVSGLEVGDQVTVNGVRKGFVNDIIGKKDHVLVNLSLDGSVYLNDDASFSVDMLDLMGGKKVEIHPGYSGKEIDYKMTQNGDFSADIPGVMKVVGTMNNDLPKMLAAMNTTLEGINSYLKDEKLKSDITTSMSELAVITIKMNDFIENNSKSFSQLIENGNALVKDSRNFINDNSKDINSLLIELKQFSNNAEALVEKVDGLITETKSQQNNMGKALYDEKFLSDIRDAVKQAQDLFKVLSDQLKGEGVNVDAKIDLF